MGNQKSILREGRTHWIEPQVISSILSNFQRPSAAQWLNSKFPSHFAFQPAYPLASKVALCFKNTVFPKFARKYTVFLTSAYVTSFPESDFHSHCTLPISAHRPAFYPLKFSLNAIYSLMTFQIRRTKQCFPVFYSYCKSLNHFYQLYPKALHNRLSHITHSALGWVSWERCVIKLGFLPISQHGISAESVTELSLS